MKRNRIGYLSLLLVLTGFLFFTSKSFWALIILFLIAAGLISVFLLKLDAKHLKIYMQAAAGAEQGKTAELNFLVAKSGSVFAARSIILELELTNKILDKTEKQTVSILLDNKLRVLSMPLSTAQCGQICVKCTNARLVDVFNLYTCPIPLPESVYSVIYPKKTDLQMTLSYAALGTTRDDGLMQNRKGSDPSEMYDIREYVPGDDVRSIHWKLSSKTDNLILRQASEPSHYNIVILPDYGMNQIAGGEGEEMLGFAISLGASIGEKLINQGIRFCMALPANNGLKIFEITDKKQFRKTLSEWMGVKVQAGSGFGIQYFSMNHMDRYFTRLIILSAGTYEENIKMLEGRIAVTVLNASKSDKMIHTKIGADCDVIELPIHQPSQTAYHIIC